VEALRETVRGRKATIGEIAPMSRLLKVGKVVQLYLEAMQSRTSPSPSGHVCSISLVKAIKTRSISTTSLPWRLCGEPFFPD
jgi:hypothetical protein